MNEPCVEKKIKRAMALYPIYEGLSGDLLFFSVTEVLFLTLTKGLTVQDYSILLLVATIADLLLNFPVLKIIDRIGNDKAVIIGSALPLLAILLITFGNSLALIALGEILFFASNNFQTISAASIYNDSVLLYERDEYLNLYSKSNIVYSVVSVAAASAAAFLYGLNPYYPSCICAILCAATLLMSFFIKDYSSPDTNGFAENQDAEEAKVTRVNTIMVLLLVSFCIVMSVFVCSVDYGRLALEDALLASFEKEKAVSLFGAVILIVKIFSLLINAVLPKIVSRFGKSRILITSSFCFLLAIVFIAAALLSPETTHADIVLIGAGMTLATISKDPIRVILRAMTLADNDKTGQRLMLVLLNTGQSVTDIIIKGLAAAIIAKLSLGVFFAALSVFCVAEIIIMAVLVEKTKHGITLLDISTVLSAENTDYISAKTAAILKDAGFASEKIIAYKIYMEENMIRLLKNGAQGKEISVIITSVKNNVSGKLICGAEVSDPFALAETDDEYAEYIRRALGTKLTKD